MRVVFCWLVGLFLTCGGAQLVFGPRRGAFVLMVSHPDEPRLRCEHGALAELLFNFVCKVFCAD